MEGVRWMIVVGGHVENSDWDCDVSLGRGETGASAQHVVVWE